MDRQGAFDTVMRNRLVLRLRGQGWPYHLARWAEPFMEDRSARARYQDTHTPTRGMDLAPYPSFHQLPGLSGVGKARSLRQSSLTISKFINGQAIRPHIAIRRSHATTDDIAWYSLNSKPVNNHPTAEALPFPSTPEYPNITSGRNSLLASEIEDDFLADLADGDFSSPSSYLPFTNPDSRPSQSHSVSLQSTVQASTPHRAFRNTTAPTNATTNTTARELSSTNCILHPFGPERTTTQLSSASNSTGESQASLPIFDSLEENDFFFDSPASSFSEAMPPATRRSTTAAAARTGSAHASKRRRTSTTAAPAAPPRPTSTQRKSPATRKDMDVEELFGTKPTCSPIDVRTSVEFDTIDLTETNEVFEKVRKLERDDRVRLAAFQCVICMDDCSNLTVTHCGHLYCASCLHQSLHVDVTKVKCPMCRQKLDMKPRNCYDSTTKGYWPLELKLMTATRKGKRKANTLP
ncbi:E3 ubiquitin-protein ligase complex slx8-rfp subunit slx8 [Fusarium oxysporum f. sp. cubense race 1]|uniref:E3 ubiquitin-protein ligase complex slx8-rfp subunit slx8 n=1 Tax=Fusarium oxysporum f. sp. cubense (strain race 1) TaxID=1229664 RepID=N4TQH5_FUSC1|nr:E3 ubiquitin-protein ligase complex slx8-rfp subunit slx8 [Fusarium oxysporum f. sp. cubense race 1]